MRACTIEEYASREAWLAARPSFLGASESAAVLGHGYANQTPFTVWASKIAPEAEGEEREEFEWGHAIQPVVLELFSRRTGMAVSDPGAFTVRRSRDRPWLAATLDGLAETPEGPAVVEIKNVGEYRAGDWLPGEPPLRVQIQIQHQLAVTGLKVGYAVAAIGGRRLYHERIERDDRFIDALLGRLTAFWCLVESRTPPEVDGSPATTAALARLHPDDDGRTVELPAELAADDEELAAVKGHLKDMEARKTLLENRLKAAIGGATFGQWSGGPLYSFKTQTRVAHEVKASTFRVLRRAK